MDPFEHGRAGMKPRRLPAMSRRNFLATLSASLPLLRASLAKAEGDIPTSKNIKWACSEATWGYYPPEAFTDILDVMKEIGRAHV